VDSEDNLVEKLVLLGRLPLQSMFLLVHCNKSGATETFLAALVCRYVSAFHNPNKHDAEQADAIHGTQKLFKNAVHRQNTSQEQYTL
jgi:hypothetical protein